MLYMYAVVAQSDIIPTPLLPPPNIISRAVSDACPLLLGNRNPSGSSVAQPIGCLW